MVISQLLTDKFAIYNSDNMYVLKDLADNSVDLSIYSPPFATKEGKGLYCYSSHPNDYSNCDNSEQFMQQYDFLVKEIARVTKPGRITAVHCTDIMNKDNSQWDFPHEIEKIHLKHGFKRYNKISIWKEPLEVRRRTMVTSLMHCMIIEDATECFPAMPDYVLIFKKDGKNEVPVTHPYCFEGFYAGATPFLDNHKKTYGDYETFVKKWKDHKDPYTNKLSHLTWQRYASGVWDDIRVNNILEYKDSKTDEDEKHVHPMQLDIYYRLIELYSNPNEVILEPFMGVGSGVYAANAMSRKAIGVELKTSYYNQSIENLKNVVLQVKKAPELFDNISEL